MTVPVTDPSFTGRGLGGQQWMDCGLLRCTIERQLSRKPTFLPGAASGAIGHDLSFTKHSAIGSFMRIAD
ncbi:MAG: hypothetical protein WBN08_04115, partial [Thiogranum sp.]